MRRGGSRLYTLELPAAGELFLWDTMPDHGFGQVETLRVTASGKVIGFGTLHENGMPRCFLHRRDLEGKYTEADDIQVIFPDKNCVATDLEVDGEALYVLVSMMGGDGPRWRVGGAAWGEEPTILLCTRRRGRSRGCHRRRRRRGRVPGGLNLDPL